MRDQHHARKQAQREFSASPSPSITKPTPVGPAVLPASRSPDRLFLSVQSKPARKPARRQDWRPHMHRDTRSLTPPAPLTQPLYLRPIPAVPHIAPVARSVAAGIQKQPSGQSSPSQCSRTRPSSGPARSSAAERATGQSIRSKPPGQSAHRHTNPSRDRCSLSWPRATASS